MLRCMLTEKNKEKCTGHVCMQTYPSIYLCFGLLIRNAISMLHINNTTLGKFKISISNLICVPKIDFVPTPVLSPLECPRSIMVLSRFRYCCSSKIMSMHNITHVLNRYCTNAYAVHRIEIKTLSGKIFVLTSKPSHGHAETQLLPNS